MTAAARRSMAQRLAVGRAAMARQARTTASAGVRMGWGRGGYDVAREDLPETRNWRPGLGSPDADTLGAMPRLRELSRDAMRNMPLARGGMATLRDNVVGTGLMPEPAINRELLGLSDDAAEAWEARAKELALLHLQTTAIDVRGRLDFVGLQQQALTAAMSSGDCFALRRSIERPGETLATCYSMLEADRVATPLAHATDDRVRDGVELGVDGEPVAYHVVDRHPGDSPYGLGIGTALGAAAGLWGTAALAVTRRIPARVPDATNAARWTAPLVLHVADLTERPELTRAVPVLAPVIVLLKQLTRYTDSELAAAVISSFFTVFITTPDGVGMGQPGAGQSFDLGRGAVIDLNAGEKIEIADPKRPNVAFDPFVQAILRQVGVALGLPFELLIKHFTASYSASRAALLEAWRMFRTRQQWLVRVFCQPVWEAVIAELVARGRLNAPGFFTDPTRRRAWLGCEWHGPTMGQLNPLDEVQAARERVDGGFSTIAEETVQLNGGSFDRNHRQRVKEVKRRVADGLEAPVGAAAPRPAAQSTARQRDAQDERERPAPNGPPPVPATPEEDAA